MSNVLNILKSICLKVYSLSPFLSGVTVGYIFKPEVKWLLDTAISLIKGLIKL